MSTTATFQKDIGGNNTKITGLFLCGALHHALRPLSLDWCLTTLRRQIWIVFYVLTYVPIHQLLPEALQLHSKIKWLVLIWLVIATQYQSSSAPSRQKYT